MIRETLRRAGGRMIIGLLFLFVGGYYLLRNTLGFDLGELDGEAVWPVLVVAFGAWILYRGLESRGEGSGRRAGPAPIPGDSEGR